MSNYGLHQIGLPDRELLRAAVEVLSIETIPVAAAEGPDLDSWITSFVADSRTFAFVALDGGPVAVGPDVDRIVGWTWGAVTFRPDGPRVGRIEALTVATGHRRSGIGTMLFDASYREVRRLGAESLHADLVGGDADSGVEGFLGDLRPATSLVKRVRWAT